MNPPRAALRRLLFALSVVAGTLTVALNVAEASNDVITLTSSNATIAPGAQVTLTAGMPVSSTGTVSQEIVQAIDPTKMKLTSVADISYPTGWTLSYCSGVATDCTITANFSAVSPANAAAWAAVKAVKATGSIDSQGGNAGRQVAQASVGGGSVTQTPTTLPASALGLDGFKVFFDAERTRVFNLYHHSASGNNNFDCYVVRTGARCVGFPFRFGGTTGEASLGVVVGSTAWLGGNDGLYCVDLSAVIANTTNVANGGSPTKCFSNGTSALLSLKSGSRFDWFAGATVLGQSAETKLFALDSTSTAAIVYCIDTATRAACNTPTINPSLVGAGSQPADGSNIYQWGDRLFVSVANMMVTPYEERVTCVLISTGAKCPGFSADDTYSSQTLQFGKFVPIPSVNGSVRAVCYYRLDTTHKCWEADGTQRSASDYNFPNWATVANATATYAYGVPTQIGSRVYYGNARWQDPTPTYTKAEVICYDAAAFGGTGGRCNDANANLTSSTTKNYVNYTVTPDPVIPNCLWITQHSNPVFKTVNILTGDLGCSAIAPNRVTFAGATSVPRMGCSATSAIAEWASFTLVTPSTGFTSAKLTVQDSSGTNIQGWTDVAVTTGSAFDLSALSVEMTGQTPNFVVGFEGASGVLNASARIKVIGDAPQLCLRPTAQTVCLSGTGPLTGLAASSMTVSASGSATDSSNVTTPLASVSTSVSVSAPTNVQCGATLSGTATLSGSVTGVAGATVSLLDSSGNPVLVNGSPLTATTAADGSYSFGFLFPGAYKVRFADVGVKTIASTTVTGGGSGSTSDNTAATSLVSNTSTLAVGTNGVVNGVFATPVLAVDDVSSGLLGAVQTINVKANDSAATGNNLTSPTITLCSTDTPPSGCTLTSKTVSGQGSYSVSGGNVVFTPCSGANTPLMTPACTGEFSGIASSVGYQITDSGGQSAVATITPTVIPPPTANADVQSGSFDTNQTYTPAGNDTAGSGATVVVSSVRLCPTSAMSPFTVSNCSASSVTTTDGVYTLDAATGVVTFDPASTFTGVATVPVRYVVQDSLNQVASSTITPTVTPPGVSVAVANSTSGVVGATQSVDLLVNDTAAVGVTLTVSSTRLCAVGVAAPSCGSTSLDVANVGSYSLVNGTVTFTPCTTSVTANCASGVAFTGTASPVGYQVSDSVGRTVSSTYTPHVVPPPTAVADAQTGSFDTNQTYTPHANDTAGSGATVVVSSVRLCPTSAVSPFTVSNCSASSVTTTDGVYTLDTATGVVTFDPVSTFTGTASVSVRYVVQDSLNQTASATITPTVTPPAAAVANPNMTSGVVGAVQTVDLLTNDTTPSGVTLMASSTRLCAVGVAAPNCVSTNLDVANVGSYSLVNGTVTFTPCTTSVTANCASGVAFTGTASPVGYQVSDNVGRTVSSTYTPHVVPPPTAVADAQTGSFDTNQTYTPHANDTAGSGTSLAMSPAGICLSSVTVATSCSATTLNVAGEGTYTLDTTTGVVTFDPESTFTGTATSIKYAATDSLGQKVLSTITPTVTPPGLSVANANMSLGVVSAVQSVNLLTNDTTPSGVTLTASSTRLCAVGVAAPSCGSTSLDVANVGSYSLVNGTVTFTPCGVAVTANCASGVAFTGTASPVGYQVSDSVGRTVSSTYTPTVVPPPVSSPDGSQGVRGEQQTITLISNDKPGDNKSPLLPASIRLCDTTETTPNCSKTELVVPGEGSYRLNPNGTVVFTPEPNFEGSATPVRYIAVDELGQSATSTLTVKVVPPPAPITDDDTRTGPPNRPIVFDPTANDKPGVVPAGQSGRVNLVLSSLRLCAVGEIVPNCTATELSTVDGVYTVDTSNGWVTFMPHDGFVGAVTQPVTYQIANDWAGPTGVGVASAVILPIIDPQAPPSALPTTGGLPFNPIGSTLVLTAIGIVVMSVASRRRQLLH